jgi:C1A family cysteine protease
MAKYYIKCGSLELIYSTNKKAMGAAIDSIWETNDNDTLDEHFYIDERGFRDYTSADNETKVLRTEKVMQKAGWIVE